MTGERSQTSDYILRARRKEKEIDEQVSVSASDSRRLVTYGIFLRLSMLASSEESPRRTRRMDRL